MPGQRSRTGVWLVGARGSVATTVVAGTAALRAGLAGTAGCVTEQPGFPDAGLPALSDLVFGGHDVACTPLPKRAEQLVEAGVLPHGLPAGIQDDLAAADAEIRQAPLPDGTTSQGDAVAAIRDDIVAFRERHGLARVVVVNVSSTEPVLAPHPAHDSAGALRAALAAGEDVLPPSSLYALAAITAGCAHVDFTPSAGMRIPALHKLAEEAGVPYAGNDGKTGETLLKATLGPMFAARGLRVRAWSGTNLLGGGDGETLADPAASASKEVSKQHVLGRTLGHPVEGEVHIDYVPSLGDWKTAWDHVAFDGFLGVRMNLQFTWVGCDSALAAPLVMDLARLTARAHERGVSGPLGELGFFFKDPVGTDEHAVMAQYETLRAFAAGLGGGR
ncbi:inositol-3-phosphate synthase [Streptomyces montanisoli]|uniref:Inositol-3-phosphate synthase n=1 Tax=Streptomyces montanisoli TaxID=2798581 RepID=A0A940MFJ7_9ACTN|nr:inositol-3-phosphate synthase [Streptomyces montanisoli]MBP0460309.1 inositol-3-phosphate synthase [Streptomyces montanisoli]